MRNNRNICSYLNVHKHNMHICTYINIPHHSYIYTYCQVYTQDKQTNVVFNVLVSRYLILKKLASGSGTWKAIGMSLFFSFYFYAIIFPTTEHSLSSLIKQGPYDWSSSISLKFLEGTVLIGLQLAESKGKLWITLPRWQLTVWPDFLFFETEVQDVVSKTTKDTDISNYI